MNRWSISISTTAAVVLFTIGMSTMLEQQNYLMSGLFLICAFGVPLLHEAMRDKLLKGDPKVKIGDKSVDDSGS